MPKIIGLNDNRILTDSEFAMVCKFCDILAAIAKAAPAGQDTGGKWWGESSSNPAMTGILGKDRSLIDHSILLDTRFRDFPTIAYDMDGVADRPDYHLRRYMRLKNALPERWHVKPPRGFGEIGWNVGGYPVNRHSMIMQERVSGMYLLGALDRLSRQSSPVVLEIGPGAGELAETMCRALPACTWINCDLTESLIHSTMHLAVWQPQRRHFIYAGGEGLPENIDLKLVLRTAADVVAARGAVISVPSYLLAELTDHLKVDLALNFWSFGEMGGDIIDGYASALAKMLGSNGALVEQNNDDLNAGAGKPKTVLARHFASRYEASFYLTRPPVAGGLDLWTNRAESEVMAAWRNRPETWPLDRASRRRVIKSFDDHDDAIDFEYSAEMWDRLKHYGLR